MTKDSYNLIHTFINQDPNFVLGFEAGQFYARCVNEKSMPLSSEETLEDVLLEGTYHSANEGELLRIADYHGFSRVYWKPTDDPIWINAGFMRGNPKWT